MPNKDAIRAWVEELRSGAVEQARGALRVGDARCCLGVACDVFMRERQYGAWIESGDENAPEGAFAFQDDNETVYEVLPDVVAAWLDLNVNPVVRTAVPRRHSAVGHLNDGLKWSFLAIADAIERTYLTPDA